MTEVELDRICSNQKDCDCNCMNCEIFARYMESENR